MVIGNQWWRGSLFPDARAELRVRLFEELFGRLVSKLLISQRRHLGLEVHLVPLGRLSGRRIDGESEAVSFDRRLRYATRNRARALGAQVESILEVDGVGRPTNEADCHGASRLRG